MGGMCQDDVSMFWVMGESDGCMGDTMGFFWFEVNV